MTGHDDLAATLQSLRSPFVELLDLRITGASTDEVTAELTVDPARHLHPWGAVHGGVYCAIIETLATVGAQMSAISAGALASGVENHTSFVRQVREGELRAHGVALHKGRRLHLWEVRITDERDRLVARGTVRLALLPTEPDP